MEDSKQTGLARDCHNCKSCDKPTKNPKFCSKSCAATYNNIAFPKRKAKKCLCKHCGTEVTSRRTVCDSCNPSIRDWSKVSLKDVQNERTYQRSSRIRALARGIYKKSEKPQHCIVCGYDKHFEVCHIQAINSFEDTALVSDINAIGNLAALCPNCHWELDHGLLVLGFPEFEYLHS